MSDVDPMKGQPVFRWQEMADYVPGRLVLLNDGMTKKLGFGQGGKWFEMVDGDEYELEGYEPTEWCDPPNGVAAWA